MCVLDSVCVCVYVCARVCLCMCAGKCDKCVSVWVCEVCVGEYVEGYISVIECKHE